MGKQGRVCRQPCLAGLWRKEGSPAAFPRGAALPRAAPSLGDTPCARSWHRWRPVAFKGLCGPGLEPRQQPDIFQETQDPENRSPAMIAKLKEGEMGQWGALGSRATRA